MPASTLAIGGLVPFTTTDYPGKMAAVVFCQGCPWRCGYCHNPHLIPMDAPGEVPWVKVVDFLRSRRGKLEAVVFSGGEPTRQAALPAAMRLARGMGFSVGLHTAGPHPANFADCLALCDWVGMDLKAPFGRYGPVTGSSSGGSAAQSCARLLIESGIAHEFRTTWHPALLPEEEVVELAAGLCAMGGTRWFLQPFRADGCARADLAQSAPTRAQAQALLARVREVMPGAQLRE